MDLVRAEHSSVVAAWEEDWRSRPWYLSPDRRANFSHWATLTIQADVSDLGVVALGVGSADDPDSAFLADVWVTPEHRHSGHATRALGLAEQWCREHRAREVLLRCAPDDPAQMKLFASYAAKSRHMTLAVAEEQDPGLVDGESVEPMSEAEFLAFREAVARSYVEHDGDEDPPSAEALAKAGAEVDRLLPDGPRTGNHEVLTLHAHGEPVASLWLYFNESADEAFVYDVIVSESYRGKGYGRKIMMQAPARAASRGLGQVRLHVFEQNQPAIGLYRKLGYRTTMEFRVKEL